MTEPLITEDVNDDPDTEDDGLGMTEPEVVSDADVDEASEPEAPDAPVLDKEV